MTKIQQRKRKVLDDRQELLKQFTVKTVDSSIFNRFQTTNGYSLSAGLKSLLNSQRLPAAVYLDFAEQYLQPLFRNFATNVKISKMAGCRSLSSAFLDDTFIDFTDSKIIDLTRTIDLLPQLIAVFDHKGHTKQNIAAKKVVEAAVETSFQNGIDGLKKRLLIDGSALNPDAIYNHQAEFKKFSQEYGLNEADCQNILRNVLLYQLLSSGRKLTYEDIPAIITECQLPL